MSLPLAKYPPLPDRPGWIPPAVGPNWDPNPYAYQTEEELMPAGGLHGQILAYLMELMRHPLKQKGMMLLMDSFLIYRDSKGIIRRVAPDLMLTPHRFPPPSAYHLEQESDPPLCALEVTSPKSHARDQVTKAAFYHTLKIPGYLVIDAITPSGELRKEIILRGWHKYQGRWQRITPDPLSWFIMPNMGLCLRAQGQSLQCKDQRTGKVHLDTHGLDQALREATTRIKAEGNRTAQAIQQSETEARRADSEGQRADSEGRRADSEGQRADKEAQRANDAESEIVRLRALLS